MTLPDASPWPGVHYAGCSSFASHQAECMPSIRFHSCHPRRQVWQVRLPAPHSVRALWVRGSDRLRSTSRNGVRSRSRRSARVVTTHVAELHASRQQMRRERGAEILEWPVADARALQNSPLLTLSEVRTIDASEHEVPRSVAHVVFKRRREFRMRELPCLRDPGSDHAIQRAVESQCALQVIRHPCARQPALGDPQRPSS